MRDLRARMFLVASLVATAACAAGEVSDDLAGLQGTWSGTAGVKKKIVVTMEIRGKAVSVLVKPPIGATIRASGALRIDPTTAPKSIDWVGFTGNDGQTLPENLGIYELAGDSFRVCTGGPDNPRPSTFEPGEGMLADVVTFTRKSAEPVRSFHATDPLRPRGLDPRADRRRGGTGGPAGARTARPAVREIAD